MRHQTRNNQTYLTDTGKTMFRFTIRDVLWLTERSGPGDVAGGYDNKHLGISDRRTPMRFATRQSVHIVCIVLIAVAMPHSARSADEAKIKQLLKERLAVLNEVVALASRLYGQGSVPLLELNKAKQAACKAELDLCETDVERIAVLEKRLAIARQEVEIVKRLVSMAEVSTTDLLKAQAKQLKIEVALERLKGN